ncbi:Myotubularin-related 10-B [Brachionus plicatilis]|uniref:Myotubularin-related 10-B n=1 Tax=Brachionus plicatilis TaxID=10195 RepID=A0A3M7RYE6_BRAPC|nr:Myotubularin-related 10-B [Brachionus plicatilis]
MSSNTAKNAEIGDDFEFIETDSNKNSNFDELDEYMTELSLTQETAKNQDIQSYDSSLLDEDNERASPVQTFRSEPDPAGKSQFYFPNIPSSSNLPNLADPDLEPVENLDEKLMSEINNVLCLKSENTFLNGSPQSKDIRNKSVYMDGRLILTNYRLVFVPLDDQVIKENSLFCVDKRLQLFHHKILHTISIPLASIHEIKACFTPEKFKKLKKNADFLNMLSSMSAQVVIQNRLKSIVSSVERKKFQSSSESDRLSYFCEAHLKQDMQDCCVDDYMLVFTIHGITGKKFQSDSNLSNVGKDKRFGKLGSLLSASPKSTKSTPSSGNQTAQFQLPLLASLSNSNPFSNSGFPIWSYTDINSGCSLFVVPAANRPEDADILLKNFNSLICDEEFKIKNLKPNGIKISDKVYQEYEFFKFKVPFSYHKIESSYQKLSNICTYKSIEDYQEENEDFLSKLNSSKWLKHISETLALTSKIINSLSHRNVFIEEYRSHMDMSCVLTSLTKICLNQKYRTISGLENLVQKDWFLAGHNFYQRFNQSQSSDKRRPSLEEEKKLETIAPVFLFFLDCLFQLLIQYPNEFEFNEFYLINLWDYSISGLSFTFSFNGMSEFFDYMHSKNDTQNSDGLNFLNELFFENNKFWLAHLEKSAPFYVNKYFSKAKSDRKKTILIPCDRMYMLRFWSRCYLRWVERYHAYNSIDNDHVRQAPPLPPKPPKEEAANFGEMSDVDIIKLIKNDSTMANTRITDDVI